MKRRDFIAIGLSVVALAACSKRQSFSALPAGTHVLAFGDSVTYGTGAGTGEDWPSLLAGPGGKGVALGVAELERVIRQRLRDRIVSMDDAAECLKNAGICDICPKKTTCRTEK